MEKKYICLEMAAFNLE